MPLVTSHSRDSAEGRSQQISRPKSTTEGKLEIELPAGRFTCQSWNVCGCWTRKKSSMYLPCGMCPQTREELAQGLKINWLGDEAIASGILDFFGVLKGTIAGDGYDQHVRKMLLFARPMN